MANELDAIKARLGERNVSNAEIGKLVGQAVNSGAEPQALAEILQAAYAKVGNKEIIYDPKEIKAEPKEVTAENRIARARARKAEYGIKSIKPQEKGKEVVTKGSKKAIKAAEKAAKKAEKEAQKAAKKAAKQNKKAKDLKEITDRQKEIIKKGIDNERAIANLENNKKGKKGKEEEKNRKKGKEGKEDEPKTASEKQKQMMKKLEPLKMQGLDISEEGAYWMLNVQTPHGKVQVNVTDAVEQLRNINAKIDQANGIIDNANKSKTKPDISLSPQSTSINGQGVKTPDGNTAATPNVPTAPSVATAAPEVPTASSTAIEAVKRETFAAELANFKDADGTRLGDKLSEKDLKFIAKTALDRFNDEKILKKLKEKEEQEKKQSRDDKSQSPYVHSAERGRGE